ncbi:MAG: hypothetical protein KGL94_12665 [Acidobacteriota bacterium]|nr:hypothetical protein [Acidobacteriota bacterium]
MMRRSVAGALALATFALAGIGFVLRRHIAGIVLLVVAIPVAVLAWVALGAPVSRRSLRDR